MKKVMLALLFAVLFVSIVCAADTRVEDVISHIKTQKDLIKSYEATLITTCTGPYIKGKQVQKAKVFVSGNELMRTDTFGEVHQVTLRRGDTIQTFDSLGNVSSPEEIQETTSRLSDPHALQQYLDMVLVVSGDTTELVGAVRANANDPLLSKNGITKVIFSVDTVNATVTKVDIFNDRTHPLISFLVGYMPVGGIPFPAASTSSVQLQDDAPLVVSTRYEKIKLNEGFSPEQFDPEAIQAALAREREGE